MQAVLVGVVEVRGMFARSAALVTRRPNEAPLFIVEMHIEATGELLAADAHDVTAERRIVFNQR